MVPLGFAHDQFDLCKLASTAPNSPRYSTSRSNLVPRAQPRGEPRRRRHTGCLFNFGPKPNPFAGGRQVKNERRNAISVKKDSLAPAAKR